MELPWLIDAVGIDVGTTAVLFDHFQRAGYHGDTFHARAILVYRCASGLHQLSVTAFRTTIIFAQDGCELESHQILLGNVGVGLRASLGSVLLSQILQSAVVLVPFLGFILALATIEGVEGLFEGIGYAVT